MKDKKQLKNIASSTNGDSVVTIHDILKYAGARTVRKLRKIKGISQGEAALIADISQSYLSNVEHAKHVLSIPKLFLFSYGINVNPEYFFNILIEEVKYVSLKKEIFETRRSEYSEYINFNDYIISNLFIDL